MRDSLVATMPEFHQTHVRSIWSQRRRYPACPNHPEGYECGCCILDERFHPSQANIGLAGLVACLIKQADWWTHNLGPLKHRPIIAKTHPLPVNYRWPAQIKSWLVEEVQS